MNCNKAMVLMSAAIDGELSPKEEEGLAQHLAECPECRTEYQYAKKNKIPIRERIARVEAPNPFVESLHNYMRNINTSITHNNDIEIIVDSGSASPEEIGELLHEISYLYRLMGGSGIIFTPSKIEVNCEELIS